MSVKVDTPFIHERYTVGPARGIIVIDVLTPTGDIVVACTVLFKSVEVFEGVVIFSLRGDVDETVPLVVALNLSEHSKRFLSSQNVFSGHFCATASTV